MLLRAPSADRAFPAAEALAIQGGAAALAGMVVLAGAELTLLQWALLQAAIALRIATLSGAPSWWLAIHLAFVPVAVLATALSVPPVVWALGFALLALVFGQTHRTQVPLYLAGARVRSAVAGLLPRDRPFAFVDLGCGLGGMLASLRTERPAGQFDGVELAWLPYLISRLRGLAKGFWVERRDLMTVDLARYDVVYAFLSPAPMARLWAKVRREMRPGTLFISVAFAVEGVEPDEVMRLSDSPRHTLHVFRL
jgi:hypothetical protein